MLLGDRRAGPYAKNVITICEDIFTIHRAGQYGSNVYKGYVSFVASEKLIYQLVLNPCNEWHSITQKLFILKYLKNYINII